MTSQPGGREECMYLRSSDLLCLCTHKQTNSHTCIFVEELASFFCRLGFALEDFEVDSFFAVEEDEGEEEEDFILASSASKAGARVLTTASRSDCLDRDCTAGEEKPMSVRQHVKATKSCLFIGKSLLLDLYFIDLSESFFNG